MPYIWQMLSDHMKLINSTLGFKEPWNTIHVLTITKFQTSIIITAVFELYYTDL